MLLFKPYHKYQDGILLAIGKWLIRSVSFFSILFFSLLSQSFAQQKSFRRHFLIAYDVSAPFIHAEKSCYAFKQALIDLLSGKNVKNYLEGNADILISEKNNNYPLF